MTPEKYDADRAVALLLEWAKLRETRMLKVLLPGILTAALALALGGGVALAVTGVIALCAITDAQFSARETVLRTEIAKLEEAEPERIAAARARVAEIRADARKWRNIRGH